MTHKHAMFRDTALYSLANYVAQSLGIVTSVLLRRFMGPFATGVWSILQVILGYCGYASFGTTKAMARDYPYLRGRGEDGKAERLKDLIMTFSMAMSVIPAVAIAVYLLFRWNTLDSLMRYGLVFLTFFLFIQRFYDLVMTLLRSDRKFLVLSALVVLNAAGMLASSAFLIPRWGLYGQLAGMALVTLVCLAFIFMVSPYRFSWRWSWVEIMQELWLGVPLVALSSLVELLKSMDKWIIVKKLGFHELGLYSMAMLANAYVFSAPMMFAHVWYPNLQEAYGKKENASEIRGYLIKPVLSLAVICPFLCGLAIFAMPSVAAHFLPSFVAGLPAMKIYLSGTLFFLIAQFSASFLITLDKHLLNLPITVVAIAISASASLTLLSAGAGLRGVAAGTALGFGVYGLASFAAAMRQFEAWPGTLRQTAVIALLAVSFFTIVYAIDLLSTGGVWTDFAVKSAVLVAAGAPFFIYLERRTGFFTRSAEVFRRKGKTT
jgi:O-antigen/teichoic acid export membrane protein